MGYSKTYAVKAPYARTLRNMAAEAAKIYGKQWLHAKFNQTQSRPPSAPLTGQFDYKTDYSKKRKSKKGRKRAKRARKSSRRIMSVVNRHNTGAVYLVRRSFGQLGSAANASNAVGWGLYGLDGGTSTAFNGCNDIAIMLETKDPTSWANWNNSLTDAVNYQMYCQSAVMEITIRNSGDTDAIMEAYYIRGRKVLPNSFSFPSPTDVYTGGFLKQGLATDPDTGATYGPNELGFSTIGTTPFQCNLFCKTYTIYKRQKFRLPPGNEISIMIRSRSAYFTVPNTKNRTTDKRYHGVLFQQQGSPDGTGPEILAKATTVNYVCIRRYNVRFIPTRPPSDSLVT